MNQENFYIIITLTLVIMSKVFMINSKIETIIKKNSQLKDVIGEQSEDLRRLKVELLGIKQIKDLPPGTSVDEIRIKN